MRFGNQVLRFTLFFLASIGGGVNAGQVITSDNPVGGAYIAVFKNQEVSASVQDMTDALVAEYPNVTVSHVYFSALKGFAAKMTAEVAEAMADSDDIAYIEEDGHVSIDLDTWGLDRIDQEDLPLDNTYSPFGHGAGVTTYVLDTGIRISHEEFDGGRASWGTNTSGDGNDTDCHGHGTHVAGTVVGKNYGVANKAKTVAVKVLTCSGSGTTSGVVAGVDWVRNNAIKPATANMSLGGGKSPSLDTAVNNLHNSGVPTVVAAGNSNQDACNYSPAGATDVISVASSTNTDGRSSFSNWGSCVEIFAPGSNIKSAGHTTDTDYRTFSGTSMASPHVCGGAALLLEKGIPPADVLTELQSTATPNKISSVNGSPNLLLYVGGSSQPTVSPAPTPAPTDAPTAFCEDSKATFMWQGKKRRCRWVNNRRKQCQNEEIARMCPKTCGACDKLYCEDADLPFFGKRGGNKQWTCAELSGKSPAIIEQKCDKRPFYTTCRDTCGKCGTPIEPTVINFDDNGDDTAEYFHDDIVLANYWSIHGDIAHPGSGYEYGTISQPLAGFNGYGTPMTMSCPNGKFSLDSVWMTPAWANGLAVTLDGYENGSLKATLTVTLADTTVPEFFDTQLSAFDDIDSLTISTSPSHVVVDDMTISIHSPCTVPRIAAAAKVDANAAIVG